MEQHIIPLNKGVHLTPSVGEEGQLIDCVNLIPKNGSLQNAPVLKPIMNGDNFVTLAAGHTLMYIHSNSGYSHYITKADVEESSVTHTKLFYHTASPTAILDITGLELYKIESVGNTIVVLTNNGMYYIHWRKGSNGYEYKNLGKHFPELPISFGLQSELQGTDVTTMETGSSGFDVYALDYYNEIGLNVICPNYSGETITNTLLGEVNKYLNDEVYSKGKFVDSFFVRYALRLYDGSLVMHSAPVLMVCNTMCSPSILITDFITSGQGDYIHGFRYRILALLHQLDYAVNNSGDLTNIRDWSDIVRSVDIFISKPVSWYDQSGQVKNISRFFVDKDGNLLPENVTVSKFAGQNTTDFPVVDFPLLYQRQSLTDTYVKKYAIHSSTSTEEHTYYAVPGWKFDLPELGENAVYLNYKDNGNFYLLKSINLDDLSTNRTIIDIEKDYLQSLIAREQMTDDYNTHDIIIPQTAFDYNSRLNIADITRDLFNGFPAKSCLAYSNGFKPTLTETGEKSPVPATGEYEAEIYVEIEEGSKTSIIKSDASYIGLWHGNASGNNNLRPCVMYFFYPNLNAKKAYIKYNNGNEIWDIIPLEQHRTLNGAVYFNKWVDLTRYQGTTITPTSDNTIPQPNKVYTSEVNNPFFFPLSGINTIGVGEIRGICSAVKALSQGQFGQFPLYVFSTDGIWAMEVNSDGTYSVKQPVTRDVCNNPNSITQLDNAVLYATERGLNVIAGSETKLLTAQLEGATEPLKPIQTDYENITRLTFPYSTASNLLAVLGDEGTKISYDGINNIAHVYPSDNNIGHWMLNLDTMEWTRSSDNSPAAFVDGYPNATIQRNEEVTENNVTTVIGKLYEYQRTDISEPHTLRNGFLLTRETALDNPTAMKVLHDLKTMCRFHNYTTSSGTPPVVTVHSDNSAKVIPYVSNDRTKWYRLNSLKGHSWKWYRFALFTNLTDVDTLEGIVLISDLRRTDKLR